MKRVGSLLMMVLGMGLIAFGALGTISLMIDPSYDFWEPLLAVAIIAVGVVLLIKGRKLSKASASVPPDISHRTADISQSGIITSGAPLMPRQKVCPQCGRKYPPEQVYCSECGSLLRKE